MAEYLFFKERSEFEIFRDKLQIYRKNADMSISNLTYFCIRGFLNNVARITVYFAT